MILESRLDPLREKGRHWIEAEAGARGIWAIADDSDFPQTVQSYIHRIGRTGRAGRPGKAITFFSNEDAPYLKTCVSHFQPII